MFVRLLLLVAVLVVAWALVARPSSGHGPERVYVVKPADTLWSIAAEHYRGDPREAIWRMRERNRLEGTAIRPGQALRLP
jgi:nucleoid-associated protein YgaU